MIYSTFISLERRSFYLAGFVAVLIAVGLVFVQPALALTISPVRMEISGDPGQTLVGEIELLNEQNEVRTFYSSAANFEARGETGAPHFLPDTDMGLASWITVQESVTLEAGEQKTIPYSIQIPSNAEAGGYFAAILWGTSPAQQDEGQVAIGGKLGMLVLLSVTGDLPEGEGIGLLDFRIEEGRRVANSLPITFVWRFSNEESERVKPEGEIRIKNLFGMTSAVLDANPQKGNVLPGSTRKFSTVWSERGQGKSVIPSPMEEVTGEEGQGFFTVAKNQWSNFAFGPYKAELNLFYGELPGAEVTRGTQVGFRFFVIPWQLLIIIIIVLTTIGFIGTKGLKKYNRWIIEKATKDKQ